MNESSDHAHAERLIHAMAEYVGTGQAALLQSVEADIGAMPLRTVCINLLSWLSSRSRMPTMVSNSKRFWGTGWSTLSVLLSNSSLFAQVFELEGDSVVLTPGLTPEQVRRLCERVAEIHRPRMFITRRRPV
ncbi:hypothetical protein [Pseudomonas sp. CGJS7]|uniref:hypothetical protein n=1 Tax=Pseudomonas sp. CGJS7 TaxID=3109348 RepID=UPI00300A4AB2